MKTINTLYSSRKIHSLDIILGTQWQVIYSCSVIYSIIFFIFLTTHYIYSIILLMYISEDILQRQSTFPGTRLTICTQTPCNAQVLILLFGVSIINPLWAGNATCAVYAQNCCVILLHWSIVFGNHWVHWAVTMHFFLRLLNKYGGLRKMQAYHQQSRFLKDSYCLRHIFCSQNL